MKYSRIHVADSTSPAPIYTRFVIDGIRFYKCEFPKGSWQTYHYPKSTKYKDTPTCHIQPVGTVGEKDGLWPVQNAGWMSRNENFIIPIGTFTRVALEDSIRWCCTGIADNERTDYVETLKIVAGQTLLLTEGTNLLIAHGVLSDGTKTFAESKHLKIKSASVALNVIEDTYLFKWTTASVNVKYRFSDVKSKLVDVKTKGGGKSR